MYKVYDRITDNEVGASCAAVASQALACREGTPEDMLKAMRLYRAIKRVCKEEKLSAVTLSCFKMIERTGTTGCLALAMLDGSSAGVELVGLFWQPIIQRTVAAKRIFFIVCLL